jgi:hypothetical protein
MKKFSQRWLISTCLLVFSSAYAEDVKQVDDAAPKIMVDADVTSVISEPLNPLSKWESCSCRVVIKTVGFEHVSTQVQVDWLKASDENNAEGGAMKVDRSETIIAPGWCSIASARFYVKSGKLYLELSGTHTYTYEKERYVFLMQGDGVAKQIVPAVPHN